MRKGIFIILIIIIVLLGSCKSKMNNSEYSARYDKTIFELETFLNNDFYIGLKNYYEYEFFDQKYSHESTKHIINQLIDTLDNVMYELENLGEQVKDTKIQILQSKIEYGLKEIRGKLSNFMELDSMNTLFPNQHTLNNDFYKLFLDINEVVLRTNTNIDELDAYLKQFRNVENEIIEYEQLRELTLKNRIRYLYTYLYSATYVSTFQDYTGLHVHPKSNPPTTSGKKGEYLTYELALSVILKAKNYYNESISNMNNEISNYEVVGAFKRELDSTINAINDYYGARVMFPDTFYTSGEFKEYQTVQSTVSNRYTRRIVTKFYDFDLKYDEDNKFSDMMEAFYNFRDLLFNEELYQSMYSEEELEKHIN